MDHRLLVRLGGIAAVLGAILQLIATALEPDQSDNLSQAIRTVADSGVFAADRVIDLVGVLLMLFGLVVVSLTITERVASSHLRVGRPFLILGSSLGAAAVISGGALKTLADDWKASLPGDRQTYRSAFAAIRELEADLFFGAFLALGIFLALLAAAILISRTYARWIGVSAMVAAIVIVVGNFGVIVVDAAFIAVLVGFVVFMVITIALGIGLLRRRNLDVSAIHQLETPLGSQPSTST
jgi:hypothetical protein